MSDTKLVIFATLAGLVLCGIGGYTILKLYPAPQKVFSQESVQVLHEKRGSENKRYVSGEESKLQEAVQQYWLFYEGEDKTIRSRMKNEDIFAQYSGKLTRLGPNGVAVESFPHIESSALLYKKGCTVDIFYIGKDDKVQQIIHGLEDC